MKRCIVHLSCCLLALSLITGRPAVGGPTAMPDAEETKASKESEKPNSAKDSAEAEPSKDAKEAKAPEKPAAPKPAIHTVEKELLKIEVTLDGVFEAQQMTELVLRPEAWAAFKVLKAVEHGTRVKRGDLLVALDLEKIDRAIADLRKEHEAMDVALKLAEQQFQTLSKTTPMDLAAVQRSHRNLQQDIEHYFKVAREMSIKMANRMLESAQFSLEYAQEELRQLERCTRPTT